MQDKNITMNKPYWKKYQWNIWSPKSDPLPEMVQTYTGISFCTVCMGRTEDLKKTLIQNIKDNLDFPNLEFVILNYNSMDDLDVFMTSNLIYPYIKNGKIKYLKTNEPRFYSTSHSRNIAFRNASNSIVINVDADNFTGKGFANHLNKLAYLCPQKALFSKGKYRTHGRIGMYKNEFEMIGGYDEDLEGYGWEDISLLIRTMNANFKMMWWSGNEIDFSKRIITPKNKVSEYMANRDWEATEIINKRITLDKVNKNQLIVNTNRKWGYVDDLEIIT